MQRELEWVATDRKENSNKFLEVKKADESMVTGKVEKESHSLENIGREARGDGVGQSFHKNLRVGVRSELKIKE